MSRPASRPAGLSLPANSTSLPLRRVIRVNADDLVAIDVHTHAEVSEAGHNSLGADLLEASRVHFKAERRPPTLPEIAAYYRERRIPCSGFPVDPPYATPAP